MSDIHEMRDYEIRQVLRHRLICYYAERDPGTLILDELPICRHSTRADLAVINGWFSGFEIKSERDTLKRLERQQKAYSKVFDYVTMVATANHTDRVLRSVPAWWGVIEATQTESGIQLRRIRLPIQSVEQCSFSICQLLWRSEADVTCPHFLYQAL